MSQGCRNSILMCIRKDEVGVMHTGMQTVSCQPLAAFVSNITLSLIGCSCCTDC